MGYYTKKLKKIQSYRGNMPIFSNLTLTRLAGGATGLPILQKTIYCFCPFQNFAQTANTHSRRLRNLTLTARFAYIANYTIL